ncbi:unnamed protein product [Dovyalis caffra]|uniref:Carotenoid 9,10(9',10')-cleavage dioxygenase 1-like n=1 Tax=Dovyalis caffra TaxID=77055 RepID=A0AAV1RQU1_9ROSI|nr:unnamed protein product [Dovyalis caffra]
MASSSHLAFQVKCCIQRPSVSDNFHNLKTSLSSFSKPFFVGLEQLSMQIDVSKTVKDTCLRLLDVFVDSMFEFVDQPLLPSQRNFAPVDELQEAVVVTSIEGKVPSDFPEGPNPLFGGLKSTVSMFGRSSHIWVEGEGMLHALYFDKASDGSWTVTYNNKYVETETFKLEKQSNKPSFLPAIEGTSPAILSAYLLNLVGKYYSVAENHVPQEIDIFTLDTSGNWDVNGAWNRPFTSHPKRAPETGELVIMGVDARKPFVELGIVSADGKRLVHKVDLKFNRCSLSHDIGVTQRYNVIMDFPLTIDLHRLLKGGPLIKFNQSEYARIGIMPRYGDAESIKWFHVASNCTFHLLNCFEDGDQIVIRACRALDSIIPGPDMGVNKFEWFSSRLKYVESVDEYTNSEEGSLFTRCYEWRLNMETEDVKERYLTGTEFSMDFPMINGDFTGVKNKYGYAQVIDSSASSESGMAKYGSLAKLYFEEPETDKTNSKEDQSEELIKVEYHKFEHNTFCTGAAFVPKLGSQEEDNGWIITFVHNEDTKMSKAYIIDTKKFTSEPLAKIALPCRVPYGFHGAFMMQRVLHSHASSMGTRKLDQSKA